MSTRLEGTVFDEFPSVSDSFRDEAEAVPQKEKDKVDFFWVAETSFKTIPQYESNNGEENVFTEVREAASSDDLEAFYWVPIDPEVSEAVGVDSLKGSSFDAFRRGKKRFNLKSPFNSLDDRVYAIEVDGVFLVVGPTGKKMVTEDEGFHPDEVIE